MAESAWVGSSDNASVAPGSSVTYYGNFGNSAAATLSAETTEANASLVHRGASCTLKKLRVIVTTNTRAATSSVTARKNGADTSMVATITSSTTGTFTDLTDTVALVATDTFNYALLIGSTSGNLVVASISANLESSAQAFNYQSSTGSGATATASVTRYQPIAGALLASSTATEANVQAYMPAAGTLSNLRAYVTAARATASTWKIRINGADGNQTVSLTAATTGAFEDTSNTDTIAAGDLVNFASVTGTGADSLTLSCASVKYLTSTANVSAVVAGNNGPITSGVTRYFSPLGKLTANASEAVTQQAAPFAGTADYLCAVVSANASTTTATVVLRKGAADTAVTFSITGAATGSFVDSTNSVAVSAADLLSIKASGTDGTVTFRSMGLKYTATVPTAYTLTAAAGSYTYTGIAAGLRVGRALTAAVGNYTYTGQAATLRIARNLPAAVGAYAYTGQSATLTVVRAGVSYTLTAEAGSYVLTGMDVTFRRGQFWTPVSSTSETWTGVPASSETWTVQ